MIVMIHQLLADPATVGILGVGGVFLIIGVLLSVFWLWMLIDAATNAALDGTEKIVWILVIVFTHFIGAVLYFFIGRSKRGGTAL